MKLSFFEQIRKRTTIIVLFFLLTFTSCYTTQSVKENPTGVMPGTEQLLSVSDYGYEVLNKGKNNSVYDINFYQIRNYQGKNEIKIIKEKEKNRKKSYLLGCAIGASPGIVMAASEDLIPISYVVLPVMGALSSLVVTLFWDAIAKDNKSVENNIYRLTNYSEKNIIANTDIKIIYNGKRLTKRTDSFGKLTITKNDLNITYSDNENDIELLFYINKEKVGSALSIKPSEILNQYAKVKKSQAKIYSTRLKTNAVSTANYASEYKINTNYDFSDVYRIELVGMKHGYIAKEDVEVFYSDNKSDTKEIIKNYVELKINEWQKQGEFESSEKYKTRLSTRNSAIENFTKEAIEKYQEEYSDLIDWDKAEISRYDPNSETFKISIPNYQNIVISVPIKIAENFKSKWNSKIIRNQKFTLIDGNWELASLDLAIPEIDYTAQYNNEVLLAYNPSNQFVFDFEPVNITINDSKNHIQSKSSGIPELQYNINSNLPKTGMYNPDAIAVVIGNSNYKETEPVKYALNDAQLMKTYLINVLGFKEGNIIFKLNSTKADLEGIFGTNDNPKGMLYNYVKENVSDVFVFYSGHGAPGINDNKGYLVPIDCKPSLVELQGYSLNTLYKNLGKIPCNSTTMVIDACFSGAGIIKNISSLIIEPTLPEFLLKNGALLTSSSEKEVASWLDEKQHGLFTYFFLKAIHDYENTDANKDNQLTIEEIYQQVSDKTNGVPYYARTINNGINQHPMILGSAKDRVLVKYKE